MSIYKAPIVQGIQDFYGDLLIYKKSENHIKSHFNLLAERSYEGVQNKVDFPFIELNNYHPKFIGKSVEVLKSMEINFEDCKDCIAYQYGFRGWNNLPSHFDEDIHVLFESALDYLLSGNEKELSRILDSSKSLAQQTSQYGHKATLLHYLGSNGVEFWRQQVPLNLPNLIHLLYTKGADPNAKMYVYGGEFDTLSLLTSSAHPYSSGIGSKAEKALKNIMS